MARLTVLVLILASALVGVAWYVSDDAGRRGDVASAGDRPVSDRQPMLPDPSSVAAAVASDEGGMGSAVGTEAAGRSSGEVPVTLETIRQLGAGAEQALITSPSGLRFEMTKTLMDDVHFDELITALNSDLVGLDLEADLLPLIYASAGDNDITVDRLACGKKICALRLYGPSREALESYFESMTSAADGRFLSRNWEDREAPDWIERRVIFATDQSVNGFLFEDSGG